MYHIPNHKTNLNRFKITENIWTMFPDHNVVKLEISNSKLLRKSPNMKKHF